MSYICIYSLKDKVSMEKNFIEEDHFYLFLIREQENLEWAKLIKAETGELMEDYCSFKIIEPKFFNITLNSCDYPNIDSLLLLNGYKIKWFKDIISKYSSKKEKHLAIINKNIIKVKNKESRGSGFYIPKNLLLIEKKILLRIMKDLFLEFDNNKYKINIIKDYVNLQGYEIKITKPCLKR